MTSAQAKSKGQLGGLTTSSRHSGHDMTRAANAGKMGRYLAQVDAQCAGLPDGERQRRAHVLLKLDMARLNQLRWGNRKPCAWCEAAVGRSVPSGVSSTICAKHRDQVQTEFDQQKRAAASHSNSAHQS